MSILPEQRNPSLPGRASHWGTPFSAARQGQAQGSAPTTAHLGGAPEPSIDLMRGIYQRDDMKGRDLSTSPLQHHPHLRQLKFPFCGQAVSPYVDISFPLTARRLNTAALHMQNSVPRARDIKTLQHTEVFKMKISISGRERWKHAGSCCMEEKRALLQQPLNTQQLTGMGMPFPCPSSPPAQQITHSACPQGMGVTPALASR